MPRKRKTGRKPSARAPVHATAATAQAGGNILSLLDTVDKFAKKIKPASMVGDLLHSAGWDKGKVGKVVKKVADFGKQLGYGSAIGAQPIGGGKKRKKRQQGGARATVIV